MVFSAVNLSSYKQITEITVKVYYMSLYPYICHLWYLWDIIGWSSFTFSYLASQTIYPYPLDGAIFRMGWWEYRLISPNPPCFLSFHLNHDWLDWNINYETTCMILYCVFVVIYECLYIELKVFRSMLDHYICSLSCSWTAPAAYWRWMPEVGGTRTSLLRGQSCLLSAPMCPSRHWWSMGNARASWGVKCRDVWQGRPDRKQCRGSILTWLLLVGPHHSKDGGAGAVLQTHPAAFHHDGRTHYYLIRSHHSPFLSISTPKGKFISIWIPLLCLMLIYL